MFHDLFILDKEQAVPDLSDTVCYEDRQDRLGHKSDRITTHYSAPDIARLLEAAESICVRRPNTVLRIAAHTNLTQFENSANAVTEGRS